MSESVMVDFLRILVIEYDPAYLALLKSTLNTIQNQELSIQSASNLTEALICLNKDFDVIISNLNLPDSQGLKTLLELQKKVDTIPIILTGELNEQLVQEGIKLGAQDFLPKTDLNVSLLSRSIYYAIERHQLKESLKALSFTDELTGIYNRRGFFTLIEQQISLSRRMKQGFYLYIFDLDYLKHINDNFGHLAGDRALIGMSKCLRSSFRHHDIIGRIGGDEFAVAAINAHKEHGDAIKSHILDRVKQFNLSSHEPFKLAFSCGKAYYDGLTDLSLDELFQQADTDLYQEKRLTHK